MKNPKIVSTNALLLAEYSTSSARVRRTQVKDRVRDFLSDEPHAMMLWHKVSRAFITRLMQGKVSVEEISSLAFRLRSQPGTEHERRQSKLNAEGVEAYGKHFPELHNELEDSGYEILSQNLIDDLSIENFKVPFECPGGIVMVQSLPAILYVKKGKKSIHLGGTLLRLKKSKAFTDEQAKLACASLYRSLEISTSLINSPLKASLPLCTVIDIFHGKHFKGYKHHKSAVAEISAAAEEFGTQFFATLENAKQKR